MTGTVLVIGGTGQIASSTAALRRSRRWPPWPASVA